MASKFKKVEIESPVVDESLQGDVLDVDEQENPSVDGIPDIDLSSNEPAEKRVSVEDDFVKVRAREDHKCNINGTVYLMYAGKTYNVPRFVRDILLRAGKLDPV